ncbi:NUDIX hydrolase [Synechocystis sp. LKSZ1]
MAILYQEDRYLLQLRDNIPTILYPGHWGLFGGHLETGETPLEAVKREIWEEIRFSLVAPQYFDCYSDEQAIRHVFAAPLTCSLNDLTLLEGWDWALVTPTEIKTGCIYSPKAQGAYPLGQRHQRILLDFCKAALK